VEELFFGKHFFSEISCIYANSLKTRGRQGNAANLACAFTACIGPAPARQGMPGKR
jgi:hypothetical protein